MKNTNLMMSFHSTLIENCSIHSIKQLISFFELYIDASKFKFHIPGKDAANDKKMSYSDFIKSKVNKKTKDFNGIFLNSPNNLITCSFNVNNHVFNIDLGVNLDEVSVEFIEEIFLKISILFKTDLSYVIQTNVKINVSIDSAYGAHDKGIGVKAGLRDVYWLNYYGSSFALLIGKNKLLSLPVKESRVKEGGIFFKLTDKPEDAFALKDAIKAQIGEKYFVPKNIKGQKHMKNTKERSGLFGVFSHLIHLNKTPENLLVAELRPDF